MKRKGYSTVEMMLVLALIVGSALYSGKKLSETNKDVADGVSLDIKASFGLNRDKLKDANETKKVEQDKQEIKFQPLAP